ASSRPSRLNVLKPGSVNVTEYVPGRSSVIRYSPFSSVIVERTFSISAGLAASTVTPGSTAPDVSLTTPVILAALVPWALATAGSIHAPSSSPAKLHNTRLIDPPHTGVRFATLWSPQQQRSHSSRDARVKSRFVSWTSQFGERYESETISCRSIFRISSRP